MTRFIHRFPASPAWDLALSDAGGFLLRHDDSEIIILLHNGKETYIEYYKKRAPFIAKNFEAMPEQNFEGIVFHAQYLEPQGWRKESKLHGPEQTYPKSTGNVLALFTEHGQPIGTREYYSAVYPLQAVPDRNTDILQIGSITPEDLRNYYRQITVPAAIRLHPAMFTKNTIDNNDPVCYSTLTRSLLCYREGKIKCQLNLLQSMRLI